MKNVTLPVIIDCILTSFTAFLLSFVLVNYGIEKPFSYIIALCIGLLFGLMAFKFFTGKQKDIKLKKSEESLCQKVIIELCFNKKEFAEQLFFKAFQLKNLNPVKRFNGIYIESERKVHYFLFSFDGVKKSQIVKSFNMAGKDNETVLWADSFNKDIVDFATKFNGRVILCDGKKAFVTLKEFDLLPKEFCPVASAVKSKPNIKLNILNKKKAKNYLLFGVTFLIMSYFVYFKVYYIVFGCLFLMLSLVAILFGKNNKTA